MFLGETSCTLFTTPIRERFTTRFGECCIWYPCISTKFVKNLITFSFQIEFNFPFVKKSYCRSLTHFATDDHRVSSLSGNLCHVCLHRRIHGTPEDQSDLHSGWILKTNTLHSTHYLTGMNDEISCKIERVSSSWHPWYDYFQALARLVTIYAVILKNAISLFHTLSSVVDWRENVQNEEKHSSVCQPYSRYVVLIRALEASSTPIFVSSDKKLPLSSFCAYFECFRIRRPPWTAVVTMDWQAWVPMEISKMFPSLSFQSKRKSSAEEAAQKKSRIDSAEG